MSLMPKHRHRDRVRDTLKAHARKVAVIALNALCDNGRFYRLLGFARRVGLLKIALVFTLYPANEEYSSEYVYRRVVPNMRWTPKLIGFLRQNGVYGLIFGISATERDFLRKENVERLACLVERVERVRLLVGAERKTFAGILPGVLHARKIVDQTHEAEVTEKAVVSALQLVLADNSLPLGTPVLVLGGVGFIGKRVVRALETYPGEVVSLDAKNSRDPADFPDHLVGSPAVLVNISRPGVLGQYVDLLWPGVVVLNEVYPEPSSLELSKLLSRDIRAYHIVGIRGQAYPRFPKAYQGAIPCCASYVSADQQCDVLIKRL